MASITDPSFELDPCVETEDRIVQFLTRKTIGVEPEGRNNLSLFLNLTRSPVPDKQYNSYLGYHVAIHVFGRELGFEGFRGDAEFELCSSHFQRKKSISSVPRFAK